MISLIGETKLNKAFTLIEILLVAVIIGIVLALAVPNFSKGFSRFQLNQTTDDLLSVSRWAQAMAIGQGRIYALSFSNDYRFYRLVRANLNDGMDSQESFEAVNGNLGRMHRIPDALRLETQETRVEFYPDGTIDPAIIQLNSSGQKTVISSALVRGMMVKVNDE